MEQSTATGQWIDSSDGRRWWFDAGATALDFMYTANFRTQFESFIAQVDLTDWLADRFPVPLADIGERELADARALRAALTTASVELARGYRPTPGDVDMINLYAATPDIPPVLIGGSRRAGRSTARPAQALSSMAREAVAMFSPERGDRVRQCAAPDCQLVFYDDSRAGSRRWCSMQRCGNRAKVRAHRERASAH